MFRIYAKKNVISFSLLQHFIKRFLEYIKFENTNQELKQWLVVQLQKILSVLQWFLYNIQTALCFECVPYFIFKVIYIEQNMAICSNIFLCIKTQSMFDNKG